MLLKASLGEIGVETMKCLIQRQRYRCIEICLHKVCKINGTVSSLAAGIH